MFHIDNLPSSSSSASSNQGRQLHIWSTLLQITSLLVINLQLKWHRAYIFHRCATTNWNRNISSWYSCSTCCGDSHSCHHLGSSGRSFYCKEQTLPTLHSGTCYVSCAGISVAMITSNNPYMEHHQPEGWLLFWLEIAFICCPGSALLHPIINIAHSALYYSLSTVVGKMSASIIYLCHI